MRVRASALFVALVLALPVYAEPPDRSPRPMLRPGITLSSSAPQIAAVVAPRVIGVRPLPRPTERLAQVSGAGPAKRLVVPGERQAAKGQLCGIKGLTGRPISPITSRVEGCGLPDGVQVTAVSGIPLSQPLTVDCATAVAFKRWLDRGILPAIGKRGGGVARVEIFATYVCRPRNNVRGAKVSEHGRGHAVDFGGVTLKNGKTITVLDDWKRQPKVLRSIHASACGTFGTVLGPKADRYHQNHIHVDTARYRSGPYCR